jgi:hypothetical protein
VTHETTKIEIIAAESLGVRGLCCLVMDPQRRIVIDPGISLGYLRYGLLPHPLQIAMGRKKTSGADARRPGSIASRLPGTTGLRFALHGRQRLRKASCLFALLDYSQSP